MTRRVCVPRYGADAALKATYAVAYVQILVQILAAQLQTRLPSSIASREVADHHYL